MRRSSLLSSGIAATLALALVVPQIAGSTPSEDPQAQRAAVRAEAARNASQIDTSRASLAEIDAALTALQENLATQQATLEKITADRERAEQELAEATTAIEELTVEVAQLREEMGRRAIQAFVNPAGDDLLTVLESRDFTTATEQAFYAELRSQDDADLQAQLEGAEVDLAHSREQADAARIEAAEKEEEQAEQVAAVEAARAEQASLHSQLEATLDSQIRRSVELAATDRALSQKIAQEQAALAARLAQAKAMEEAAAKAAQQAAAKAAATTTAPPSTSGTTPSNPGTTPTRPPVTSPPPVTPPPPPPSGGGISLCTVGGITVSCAISGNLQNLLNAAAAKGLHLSGGGYRSAAAQIETRKRNCGTSYYAIYQMPSSQCRPPTAPPGRSQHEVGLAIDFSNCSTRGTACYQWLAVNAASFGFYNLPSEPWHWSTTGR